MSRDFKTTPTINGVPVILNSIVTTKGDLIGASAGNTPARIAVGTDGNILIADSTQATGVRWGSSTGSFPPKNVKDFGATGNGTTDDSTAIQNAANACSIGDCLYFPGGTYLVNNPITIKSGTMVQGQGWGDTGTQQSCLLLGNGASAATWNKMGVFTSDAYTAATGAAIGDPIEIRDLRIDGNSSTNGNGIILMNQRCIIERIEIAKFNGTTANSDGYCIWLAGTAKNGTNVSTSAVNNIFKQLRLQSNNTRIYANDTGGSFFTDGVVQHVVSIAQPTASNIPDIYLAHAGGWILDDIHTNGSGGASIQIASAFNTIITNSYLDGWGVGNTTGTNNCIQIDNFGTGQGSTSQVVITDCRVKARNTQASTGIYNFVSITNNQTANSGKVTIANVNVYCETPTTGTINFMTTAGTGTLFGTVTGCTMEWNGTAGNIFAGSVTSPLYHTGNSWNFGTAPPSAGYWPQGMTVHNTAPVLGDPIEWVCIASGTPGNWETVNPIETSFLMMGA